MAREALEGIRVLDISTVIAGPWGAGILADFGAEVIKVEMQDVGCIPAMGPLKDGVSIRWPSMGRNKKSVTLDFHFEEGKKLFLELVKKSDVIIENFKTGTLDKWNLGMDVLRKANPDIIVTHVTGYGQTGPNAKLAGLGTPLQAFSGMTYMTGYPDRPPVSPPFALADYVAGLNAVIGTLMALYHRDVLKGKAQEVDISLYEGIFRMEEAMVAQYDLLGTVRERSAMRVEHLVRLEHSKQKMKSGQLLSAVQTRYSGISVRQWIAQTGVRNMILQKPACRSRSDYECRDRMGCKSYICGAEGKMR